MRQCFNYNEELIKQIQFLIGNSESMKQVAESNAFEPFSEDVIDFFQDLSKELLAEKKAKKYPDVVTYAFWIRRASLSKLKKEADRTLYPDNIWLGRGLVFHIAPSNVSINYAYSFTVGLLTGNKNIVKVSSKEFPQVDIVNHAIEKVLDRHKKFRSYILFIRYGHSREINDYISSFTDVRVIWGGDATIKEIRRSLLPVRAKEIVFADRYSLAVIDSDYYLKKCDAEKTAQAFYNDTYLTDQNACTSPKIIFWTGENISKAKKVFWDNLYKLVQEQYAIQSVQVVDKLIHMYELAAVCRCSKVEGTDNRLIRVQIEKLDKEVLYYMGNSGYFYEYDCNDISEIANIVNDKCQTIGYLGEKKMFDSLIMSGVRGIDRIVPIGSTMDFGVIWDGYNLVEEMTRRIAVQ